MVKGIIEWVVGLCLAVLTLRDVFDTVVVPGSARGALRVSRRLVQLALPAWKRFGQRGVGVNFAPVVLLASFIVWMLLLMLAFGLMVHALSESFTPQVVGFGQALYVAGSALATIGSGASDAHGAASGVVVAAGFCGLAVMTMAVTYLLEVQANVALRDTGVLKLGTTSGQPPSALGLLEQYAALDCHGELPDVLRRGRDWCAAVTQSHATHPSLIYFRSAGVGAGWPATLGSLMDLTLIIDCLLDEAGAKGAAVLLRQQASHLSRELTTLLGLEGAAVSTSAWEVESLCARLHAAGYRVREHPDVARFVAERADEIGRVDALAAHLGTPGAPIQPTGAD